MRTLSYVVAILGLVPGCRHGFDASTDAGSDAAIDAAPTGCVVEVAATGFGTRARRADNTLWACGGNNAGQIGDGTTMTRSAPTQVLGPVGDGAIDIAAGFGHTCAVDSSGAAWCWGSNTSGQLGDGTMTTTSSPVAVTGLGAGVSAIETGFSHTCALKTDGTVWCWGSNATGELGDGTTTPRPAPVQTGGLSNVIAIATNNLHTCAIRGDFTLWCWGANGDRQLGFPSAPAVLDPTQVMAIGTGVVQVDTGRGHTCAVKNDDTLWCWGMNDQGQSGIGSTTSPAPPTRVSLGPVRHVSAGGSDFSAASHTCAVLHDGSAWCWGDNSSGQLGNGSSMPATSPVRVMYSASFLQIAAGGLHTCARSTNNDAYCWGYNNAGQHCDGMSMTTSQLPLAAAFTCP